MEVFLIILAIIGALSSFFKDKSDTETKRPAPMPKPSRTPSGRTYHDDQTAAQQPAVDTTSIDMQQEEQRKQLAERMNTTASRDTVQNKHDALPDNEGNKKTNAISVQQKRLKKQMNKNMKRDGLINGIIMSEVLGPPRAKKPYRNIIKQRKN